MVQVVWEHNLSVPQKVNHRITILSNNSTKYIPQRIESRYSNRYLYANFHGSFMHDDQKMETIQMSISRLMDKQNERSGMLRYAPEKCHRQVPEAG